MGKKCSGSGKPFLCFASVLLVSLSLIVAVAWSGIFNAIAITQLRIYPSSTAYKMWVKNPLPIYLEIYLFNITNAEEFSRNKSVIPNFQEVGPFLFEEIRTKVPISWDDFDETVTFNQTRSWVLVPEHSKNLSALVTNLNPIASTMAHTSRLWKSKLLRLIANTLMNIHENLFVTATAREWLFDGIPNDFLQVYDALREVTDLLIPYKRFGWFYDRNGSAAFEGSFTMKTGNSGLYDIGELVAWNNASKTDHYEDECSIVRGSTGEVIPPLGRSQENLFVFASDICSYMTLKYEAQSTVEGIDVYRYVGDASVFDNGTLYRENSCFYLGESCSSGTRNVSSCKFGSPAFISFPHFYLADPTYTRRISGMNPDEKKHKFTLNVEPVTGIPLEVDGSIQINFRIQSYELWDLFKGVPEIYVPMIWFKQTAKITKEYASLIKLIVIFSKYGSYLFYGISLLGFFLFYYLTVIKK